MDKVVAEVDMVAAKVDTVEDEDAEGEGQRRLQLLIIDINIYTNMIVENFVQQEAQDRPENAHGVLRFPINQ